MRIVSGKNLVLRLYPLACCEVFPKTRVTSRHPKWRVRLTADGNVFSKGNSAKQAWRRAYEKILQQRGEGEGGKETKNA